MAIVGGAVFPPIASWLGQGGMENALIVPLICFLVVLFFAMAGYRVKNG